MTLYLALGMLGVQMSPLGGIYTCPPSQWTVDIDLIQRLILILQNTPYKYLRYLHVWNYVEKSRETQRNPGDSGATRDTQEWTISPLFPQFRPLKGGGQPCPYNHHYVRHLNLATDYPEAPSPPPPPLPHLNFTHLHPSNLTKVTHIYPTFNQTYPS